MTRCGTFHDFVSFLHKRHGDVASFYYGKQLCVSLCSARGFKHTQALFDRPREWLCVIMNIVLITLIFFTALLFEFLLPVMGPRGLQIANGEDGRRRYKLYSDAFALRESINQLPAFNKVKSIGDKSLELSVYKNWCFCH